MAASTLTGSRIRQTRLSKGIAQGVLAETVGISPSYLNLIEHNKRGIGGRLLLALARQLGVDTAALNEGVQAEMLEAMGQAAASHPNIPAELGAAQDMAGQFPSWAGVLVAQQGRVEELERNVGALVDRLTHDPQLATSIHEMLSVVTAIRSTAGILAGDEALEPEWLARFHRNLLEDAKRLAGNAQALVEQLEAGDATAGDRHKLPKEELEVWLGARSYHIAALEGETAISVGSFLAADDVLTSSTTLRLFSRKYLERYRCDAVAIPLDGLLSASSEAGFDPQRYAQLMGCDLACVLRRMACLPAEEAGTNGLVVCDGSGTLTFSKVLAGFALPRFGAACPLWPLYQALSRPGVPIRMVVEQAGYRGLRYITYAVAQAITEPRFATAPLYEATMLILPGDGMKGDAHPVGPSCRICPREDCRGRREPSILTSGF